MKVTMIGLGAMGLALAQNLKDKEVEVAGYDASEQTREQARQLGFQVLESTTKIKEFTRPRVVWVMVPSQHVDEALSSLHEVLESGDIIIEGGNSYFKDTERRFKQASDQGINYLGVGVSGGREGARNGPSLMAGGSSQGYEEVKELLENMAAKHEDAPCVAHLGIGGAGHFVKMVHNGIEYAIMQAIADTYLILKAAGRSESEIAQLLESWSADQLIGGYLTEISAKILGEQEEGKPLIEFIRAQAKQKGTGRWAAQQAMDEAVAATSICEAVNARLLSGYDKLYESNAESVQLADAQVKKALEAAILVAFAQGFDLIRESGYDANLPTVAKIWRAGCIIRTPLLQTIADHFSTSDKELLNHQYINNRLQDAAENLRAVVIKAMEARVPVPIFASTLTYLDTRNSEKNTPRLIMAQRDYFGSHGYQRTDKEGIFTRDWKSGTEQPR